jgi:hypothetical protein
VSSARHGVWICRHGDAVPGMPAGYREVMESSPVTVSALEMLAGESGDGYELYRSCSSTDVMSLADNQSNVCWKALHFIPRKLEELHREGSEAFRSGLERHNAHLRAHETRHNALSNGERAFLLWRKLLQKIGRKWEDTLYFRQWFLLYDLRQDISTSLDGFRRITPPRDRFWADPFVVARDGKYYVFIEELPYAARKGHISLIVMDRDGAWEQPVPILEAPYHLSYPFIFEFGGSLYMIPESRGNRTVGLYKCTAFPYEWEFQRNLMEDCQAVDATLVEWHGKWWLFVNQAQTEGASLWDELFLYYSDSPLSGDWTPHRRNPVVSDARSARPAGRPFARDGRLYRPSQDCSRHYGYGLNICEVTRLTETDYEERVVTRVVPGWDRNVVSTHTINHERGLTIADGQLLRRR